MDGADFTDTEPGKGRGTHPRSAAATARRHGAPEAASYADLGQILLDRGVVTQAELEFAGLAQRGTTLSLGQVLHAQGVLTEAELMSALAECHGMSMSSLSAEPPDTALAGILPADRAFAFGAVPWRRVGAAVAIALSRPDLAADIRAALPDDQRVILTLAPRAQVLDAQIALYGETLARIAEGQVPLRDSCRAWQPGVAARIVLLAALFIGLMAVALPVATVAAAFGLTLLVFAGNMALKSATFATTLRQEYRAKLVGPLARADTAVLRPPIVTLLVPLYKEREVASTLIANLSKLDYPPERLDVILAMEADDHCTQDALTHCTLPPWIRCVQVPPGHPRTKPRALNFALNFARGSIVGIYDAEDRPEPDQIHKVVQRFVEVPHDVACLQGRLDYYNSDHNWLARCFAIEYASWFRVLLPGVQRLGLFVPLGGTTLFIRRPALEEIGGWDAHNVTEDAELGLRLARKGYRTEMVDTTTYEEANAALWPWISQRSRWQKGYLMTWATAMRRPLELWSDLGTVRFLAFQVQILFAVLGCLSAPLLWSLIVKPFGMAHPLDALLSPMQYGALAALMVSGLVLSLTLAVKATGAPHLRKLRPWVVVAELYYVFATLSAWRAVAEMLIWPFWWAKTRHGQFGAADAPRHETDQSSA